MCWGEWPRPDATLTITGVFLARAGSRAWPAHGASSSGLGSPGGPVRRVPLWLPGPDQQVAERDHTVVPLAVAQAG